MSSSSLKTELADHIYQYLCHEAQYSDLPEAARESLTAASECIEQAYKLNVNTNYNSSNINNTNSSSSSSSAANKHQLRQQSSNCGSSSILPDELLRIFTRHKEFLSQQKDSINYSLRNDFESTSIDKQDMRLSSNPQVINDPQNSSNSHPNNSMHTTANNNNNNTSSNPNSPLFQQHQHQVSVVQGSNSGSSATQPQPPPPKQPSQHPISQLPMTTRKKLSHLRAQIKRQASKAARSRLEKRSSVSGSVASGSGAGGNLAGGSGALGQSLDASNPKQQSGDGSNVMKESGNQTTYSSVDLPATHSNNPTTSSPSGHQTGNTSASGLTDSSGSNAPITPASASQQNEGANSKPDKSSHPPGSQHHHHHHHHLHQKNFKQKLIALIKKFRTDGSDFDSEEQYREALERELMKAAAGRGSRAIEELLEEDIDVEEESGSEQEDWDNISESSTPKPSLRPFFSSTTLDKI